jgi:hypothetical protein
MANGGAFAMGTGALTANEEARSPVLDKPMFKLLPTKCGTADNKKLQLAGPVGVIAAVACAEVGAQTICVVAPLLALICVGLITGRRLPLAIASNMSLPYSAVLLYGSYVANSPAVGTGWRLAALWAPSFFLLVSILPAAFLSSAI